MAIITVLTTVSEGRKERTECFLSMGINVGMQYVWRMYVCMYGRMDHGNGMGDGLSSTNKKQETRNKNRLVHQIYKRGLARDGLFLLLSCCLTF